MSPADLKSLPVLERVQSNPLAIQSFSDLQQRAEYLAQSKLIPAHLQGKPHDVAIILQMGLELDIPPMQAINGIDVIQGVPGVDPQLALALIRSRVPNAAVIFEESTSESAKVTMARDRGNMAESYTAHWTIQKARDMGLTSKANYKSQPATMLRWRAVMEAARLVFPDVIKGFYSKDELEDVTARTGRDAAGEAKARQITDVLSESATLSQPIKAKVPDAILPNDTQGQSQPQPIPTSYIQSLSAGTQAGMAKTQAAASAKEIQASQGAADDQPLAQVPQATPAPLEDPIAGWVIPFNFKGLKRGTTIGSYSAEVLRDGIKKVREAYEGKAPTGAWLQFITRADQYLQGLEQTPLGSMQFDPTFDQPEPGSDG